MGAIINVAPLVGAWIEINNTERIKEWLIVAPLVGAWIEIMYTDTKMLLIQSRSPCGSVD